MNNWKETTLDKVCSKIGSGATPRGGQDSYKEDGIALIRSQNVLDLDFNYSGLAFIDQEQADDLANVEVQKEDVLINITGDSVARVCMVPDAVLPARVNQHVSILRANSADLDPYYLKYYLINRSIKQSLLIIANSGATRNALTKGQLENFPIPLPALPEQKAIAAILSSFDDKIELLRRQNKTLESIAQTIFKEWFVKFKVKGEKLKLNSKTGLPEGWRMGRLTEMFDFMEGPGIRNWQYTESGRRFMNIRLIQNGDIDIKKANFISLEEAETTYKHFHLQERDMVVSTSGTLGRSAIVRKEHLPIILNTSVIRFRPIDELSYGFMYQFLNSPFFQNELESLASGSVQLNFGPIHLKQIEMVIPPDEGLKMFAKAVNPLYEKIIFNLSQIQTLSKLRDALLPKLMKGEIRVKT